MTEHEHWDAPLQQLLSSRVLTGYALVSRAGRCVMREGLLAAEFEKDTAPSMRQFSNLFSSTAEGPMAFNVAGQHCVVFLRTECDMHAISKRRSLCLAVSMLPFGVLVCTYARPLFPQMVLPQLLSTVDRLRT